MAEHRARGGASGELSISDLPSAPQPPTLEVGRDKVAGQFSAVINCHDCNLKQIEVAIESNQHPFDPHPIQHGMYVSRHPVYLVAYDYSDVDEDGIPAAGQPSELNLKAIREIFSTRYSHVAADAPPRDGSHIAVEGMHIVAVRDRDGNPTGALRLGNPEDAE